MFKISWGQKSDPFLRAFVIAPDVKSLFAIYFVLTGYGRKDGASPVEIRVTNLDGDEIDMTKGSANVAGQGTYSRL